MQATPLCDPVLMHTVRKHLATTIASRLVPELRSVLAANTIPSSTPYSPDSESCGKRAYSSRALDMLCSTGEEQYRSAALTKYRNATNMMERVHAIYAVMDTDCDERKTMLSEFFEMWKDEPLVMLKWLSMQAGSNRAGNLAEVKALVDHPSFNIVNPNNCYSLFLVFASSPVNFNNPDGSGYEFMADMIMKVDGINRTVASRMATVFTSYKQYAQNHQDMIQVQLKRILEQKGLSENTYEIVSKSIE